jgi:hypothetical protein
MCDTHVLFQRTVCQVTAHLEKPRMPDFFIELEKASSGHLAAQSLIICLLLPYKCKFSSVFYSSFLSRAKFLMLFCSVAIQISRMSFQIGS